MIYGYARVSTDTQDTALQTDALIAAGVADIFEDHGVSGTTEAASRPGFSACLARLRPGDTLVVYSLSRLGRSMLDVMTTVQTLNAAGIVVRSVTEPFDTGSPMGRAMAGMLAVFSQLERDLISERTKAGLAAAKSRGKKLGRPKKVAG